MKKIQIRPRYTLRVNLPPEEFLERIRKEISINDPVCSCRILTPHVILQISDEQRHYWSPQLTVEVEACEKRNGSLLRCIIGPMPAVWTMFASFYALSVFVGLVGLVWGVSQWSLDMTPYALWLVPVSVIMIGIAYIIALAGQKLGYDQMVILQEILERSVEGRTAPSE